MLPGELGKNHRRNRGGVGEGFIVMPYEFGQDLQRIRSDISLMVFGTERLSGHAGEMPLVERRLVKSNREGHRAAIPSLP